jgi:transcription antitermination factor NusG
MALALRQNPASIFPEDLFSAGIAQQTAWWVAHTKSRCEKALAHKLAEARIGYFLPLYKKIQPGTTKKRFSIMPLFPGYLFFAGGLQERAVAFKSNQITQVLSVVQNEQLTEELRQIQRALGRQMPVYPHAFVKRGQKVRVKSGLLEGLEGIIAERRGKHRLILKVTFISQAVAVDVAVEDVEPL